MDGTGRKDEPTAKADEAAKKPPSPPLRSDDDDEEDGDIATPKRDRCGTDDEPL